MRLCFPLCAPYAKITRGDAKMHLRTGACAILVATLSACSSDPQTINIDDLEGGTSDPTPTKDGGRDAGTGADADTGTAITGVGPIVSVTAPAASTDPIAGPVLSGASVDVRCGAEQRPGAAPVDPTKVAISLFVGDAPEPKLTVPGTLMGANGYGASLPLDDVPSGRVRLRCAAKDSAAAPAEAVSEISTFYDAGPSITFTNLNPMSVIARGATEAVDLTIQFKVEPSLLAEADAAADVNEVKLDVSGKEFTFPVSADGSYAQAIDFNSFPPPVESVTVAVSATNKRTGAVTSTKQLIVKVDGEGPVITFTSPERPGGADPIVGGTVTMQMTITDALAGVVKGNVVASIEGKEYPVKVGANDTYSFTFQAGEFEDTQELNVQVSAYDEARNLSLGTFLMHVDTVPPWVSLNPGPVRECARVSMTCSAAFDPLGTWSPEDGQVVAQAAVHRALVWERGIDIAGNNVVWIAGVREGSTYLYEQSDATVPLLIDTNRDALCDAVNAPVAAPMGFSATRLTPAAIGGALPLGPIDVAPNPGVGWSALTGAPPEPKCKESEMTYVIRHTMPGAPSVVYASNTAGVCTGQGYEGSKAPGWTCIAAAARDSAGAQGNLGLSRPIRVCRKLKPEDCGGAAVGSILEPPAGLTCTDGCTVPTQAESPYNPVFVY
jgi:hypothetical protein